MGKERSEVLKRIGGLVDPYRVTRGKRFRLKDFGFDWTLSGRNGFRSPFSYSST